MAIEVAPFFDRFRVELAKYDEGVHDVGDPVAASRLVGRALPGQLADFYRSWDGARLFADTIVIVPIDELGGAEGGVRIGEWPEGALELLGDGRVRSRDDEGATIVVGSTLEKFLAAVMAREGFLVERDGEFKDVFDEEDVGERVRDKQTRAALKIDPDAAAWQLEVAERAFGDGDDAAAEAVSFRYRDGSQRNGVSVDAAIEDIVTYAQSHANESPTAPATVSGDGSA